MEKPVQILHELSFAVFLALAMVLAFLLMVGNVALEILIWKNVWNVSIKSAKRQESFTPLNSLAEQPNVLQ